MMAALHLVDDDERFRRALARLLRALGHTVHEYACAQTFLDARPSGPGCLLLDVHMPGLSGLDLQTQLASYGIVLPIIFITGQGDIQMSVRAIRAGAEDFLTKPVGREILSAAIGRALAHGAEARAAAAIRRAREERIATLSPREREVAVLLAEGCLNKQVAAALGTTERTIKAHRSHIMDKLGIRSTAELARLFDPRTGT